MSNTVIVLTISLGIYFLLYTVAYLLWRRSVRSGQPCLFMFSVATEASASAYACCLQEGHSGEHQSYMLVPGDTETARIVGGDGWSKSTWVISCNECGGVHAGNSPENLVCPRGKH